MRVWEVWIIFPKVPHVYESTKVLSNVSLMYGWNDQKVTWWLAYLHWSVHHI